MNTVQPCGSSTADQSESATSTSTGETEDDISSAVAPPIPKVQGLIDGRIEFLKTTNSSTFRFCLFSNKIG